MRARHKSWMYGVLAAGFAVSLAAVGCGDDDAAEAGSGGSGGAAGKAGSGGAKAGTGGTGGAKAGTGGTGGSSVTPAMCKTNGTTATMGMVTPACIGCACDANAAAIDACNKEPACWQLIACVRTCLAANPAMTQTACATGPMCTTFVAAGVATAMPAGVILAGATCASKCTAATDGGVDAGN